MSNIYRSSTPVVWTIGHSDSCAGTGVQADLHTFHDFELYGCNVITALVAQNSFARGYSVPTERKSIVAQINALDSDMPAKVIKVGALPNLDALEPVAKYLADYDGYVIYDLELESCEELVATEGKRIRDEFLPRVDLFVANTNEVAAIIDVKVEGREDMLAAAERLLVAGARSVLITGAQFPEFAGKRIDYWSDGVQSFWAIIEAVSSVNNRGGGSTLSAALTATIARGHEIREAMSIAKAYVTRGIIEGNQVGSGPGSVAHLGMPNEDDTGLPLIYTELPENL